MSVHEFLKQDNTYHFIEQEHKGIKYMYASNIQADNILAIIKYTMPMEIEKAFADTHACWDSLYIWCGKDSTGYFLIVELAESKDYNLSHKEIIRIVGQSDSFIINSYMTESRKEYFQKKMLRGIYGGAFEIPVYINEKK